MSMSIMELEARGTAGLIKNQLEKNTDLWLAIIEVLKKKPIDFAVTVARGSSDHAATFAKYLFEINLQLLTVSAAPSVTTIYNQALNIRRSIVFGLSQSGQSPDICDFFAAASKSGVQTIALVNCVDSPLAHQAKHIVPVWAEDERSVAATKSFIGTLTALVHFTALYNNDRVLLEALKRLPDVLLQCCEMDWSAALDVFKNANNAYITARTYGFSIAGEAALKLKETSCLHAEAFSTAEILHGPFALVKPQFPVLVFGQNDASLAGTLAVTKRMTKLGATTLFAMPGHADGLDCCHHLPLPESLHPILDPILAIQSFYIMAAKLAKVRGYNPDQPDNLLKVTETY